MLFMPVQPVIASTSATSTHQAEIHCNIRVICGGPAAVLYQFMKDRARKFADDPTRMARYIFSCGLRTAKVVSFFFLVATPWVIHLAGMT